MKFGVIGFDLDDVVLDTNEALCAYTNRAHGTNLKRADIWTWDLSEVWSCKVHEAQMRVKGFHSSPEHCSTGPIPGAIEGLLQLHVRCKKLVLVSARPTFVQEATFLQLRSHGVSHVFDAVHHVGRWDENGGTTTSPVSKGTVCREAGVELFVEDAVHHAESVAQEGIPVLLLTTPWNKNYDASGLIKRVADWNQIMTEIVAN